MESCAFRVHMPEIDKAEQGKETFVVEYRGEKRELRTHDYGAIYSIPGLYEHLFYDTYKCDSPNVVCSLLTNELKKDAVPLSDLRVLDVGAGNGMVGERIAAAGADAVVGVDIIKEAAEALERDRPGIYCDYFVEDLTQMPETVEKKIERTAPNCLTVVAALGFDDIPPEAFAGAYNLIDTPGWVAFNIKDRFLEEGTSGFSGLLRRMVDEEILDIRAQKLYRHRFCQDGTPLNYYAVVGVKREDIPTDWASAA
jgi:SAM-dependent methyltransferase